MSGVHRGADSGAESGAVTTSVGQRGHRWDGSTRGRQGGGEVTFQLSRCSPYMPAVEALSMLA
eukprot:9195430-Pyramimonas_sp.AAC.1